VIRGIGAVDVKTCAKGGSVALPRKSIPLATTALVVAALMSPGMPATAAPLSPTFTPVVACTDLDGLTIPAGAIDLDTSGGVVTSSTLVAASGSTPEHCAVRGEIAPFTGAFDIQFGVNIPTDWNGDAWQFGGGGTNGSIPGLTGAQLGQGYATFGSDSGHQTSDGVTWVVDDESWMNFAHEQINKTHDAAFFVIDAYMDRLPDRMYWQGGSQGGREGLMAATKYTEDYDGIVVSVPLAYFSALMYNPVWQGKVQYELDGHIPPAKAGTLAEAVLTLCDELDGLEDGVINDYYGCAETIDPSVSPDAFEPWICAGGADTGNDCFSDEQYAALGAFYGPMEYNYPLANGETTWPGWGGGMETLTAFGTPPFGPFAPWMLTNNEPSYDPGYYGGGGGALGGATIQARLSGETDGSWPSLNLDLDTMQAQLQELSEQLDVSTDLGDWIASGGKIIMTTTASDSISNPRAQMRLYEEWVARHGQSAVDSAVKYYVVPNFGHGGSGGNDDTDTPIVGSGGVNTANMVVEWVEQGVAPPAAPTASNDDASKPLCTYPTFPQYTGGDQHDASSYECAVSALYPAGTDGEEGGDGQLAATGPADSAAMVGFAGALLGFGVLALLVGARRRRAATASAARAVGAP
jgi:hypothetical protein